MTLEERITRLEDIEAIKQLKARYCEACDDDHDIDKLLALFTDDGVVDGGEGLKAEGKSAIRGQFATMKKAIAFAQHYVTNPIIEVNGSSGTGIWYVLEYMTFRKDEDTKMFCIRYDEQYLKIDGNWKFRRLKAQPRLIAEAEVLPLTLPAQ